MKQTNWKTGDCFKFTDRYPIHGHIIGKRKIMKENKKYFLIKNNGKKLSIYFESIANIIAYYDIVKKITEKEYQNKEI